MRIAKSLFFAEKFGFSKFVARANVRQAARGNIKIFETYNIDKVSPKKISKHFEQFKPFILQFPAETLKRLVKAVGADSQNSH